MAHNGVYYPTHMGNGTRSINVLRVGVRLELPNAEQQVPSGLKCLVRFEIEENADEAKRSTGRIVPDQARN